MLNRLSLLAVFCMLISQVTVTSQSSNKIMVGTIVAESGTKVSGIIEVPQGVDQGTIIPVSIINGSKPGPVLSLIAGQHGTEYVPVITLQRLLSAINPGEVSGTIIMVHIANVPSFKERRIYYNPIDGKNLNRQYPGNKNGTVTEKIADIITSQIIDQSDYLLDLHGGEINETILNYACFYYDCPDTKICEQSEFLAHAFGGYYLQPYPYNIVADTTYWDYNDTIKSKYCDLTAVMRGVPAVFVEAGGRGNRDEGSILYMEHGITNVMKSLKMIKGEINIYDPVIYLSPEESVVSQVDGLFYSEVSCGQYVSKDAMLGYTTDYFGKRIEEYRSPITGIVIMAYDTPVVNKDENLFYVSLPRDSIR